MFSFGAPAPSIGTFVSEAPIIAKLFALFAFVPLPPRIMEFVAEARELSFPPIMSAFSLPSRILFPSPPIAVVPESASFLFPIIRALAFTFPLIWRAFAPVS